MEVITKVPVTLDERLDYGPEMRIPSSWEEFLDLLEECEYRVQYDEGEIISLMEPNVYIHEGLVAEIIHQLGNLFRDISHSVLASNLSLHIPGSVQCHYKADCAVVKEE